MEPRKSTVGLSSRNEDTPTLSPSAHFVIHNPVAEEEEEEGVKVKVDAFNAGLSSDIVNIISTLFRDWGQNICTRRVR